MNENNSVFRYLLALYLTIFSVPFCIGQVQNEAAIRSSINEIFKKNRDQCDCEIDAVTNFNGKVEYWRICELEGKNRIFSIESYDKDDYFREVYFEEDEQLVYAIEEVKYIPLNHVVEMIWKCEFYTKKEKVLNYISLGHGKTEYEDWKPKVIFEMYERRLSELAKIK